MWLLEQSHHESTSTSGYFYWVQVLKPIYTSHACPEGTQTKTPSPCVRPAPTALPTCPAHLRVQGRGRRLIGAHWGRCHVLPHPAGGRASPHRPTSPRAGGCARRRVPGMLGGARGCFPRSAGSKTGRPRRREKRSAVAFPCPGRSSPPRRVAHLRPALGSTGPVAWLFIGPDVGPDALASRDPAPSLQLP